MNEPKTLEAPTVRIVGCGGDIDKENAPEQIGALWQRAIAARIVRPGAPSYAVYTNYEDRLANRYRVVVGVESDAEPGPDQEVVHLPAQAYAVFEATGPAAEVAGQLWRHVWTAWGGGDRRAFDVDYERYVGGPEHAELSLFIGLDR